MEELRETACWTAWYLSSFARAHPRRGIQDKPTWHACISAMLNKVVIPNKSMA